MRFFLIYDLFIFLYCHIHTGVPSTPLDLKTTPLTKESLLLRWHPPLKDGGAPLQGYHVEYRNINRPSWSRVTKYPVHDCAFQLSGLAESQTYQFRVVVCNRAGECKSYDISFTFLTTLTTIKPLSAEPCSIATGTKTREPWEKPSEPEDVCVSDVTKSSVKLSWRPPVRSGGDEVRDYIVEYRANERPWTRANEGSKIFDTSYKVSNLYEDYDYRFRVAANNRAGIGPFSRPTQPIRTHTEFRGERHKFQYIKSNNLIFADELKTPMMSSPLINVTAIEKEAVNLQCDVASGSSKTNIRWSVR